MGKFAHQVDEPGHPRGGVQDGKPPASPDEDCVDLTGYTVKANGVPQEVDGPDLFRGNAQLPGKGVVFLDPNGFIGFIGLPDRAEVLFDLCEEASHFALIGHVTLHTEPAAGPTDDIGLFSVQIADGDFGSALRQRLRVSLPDASAAARDDSDLAFPIQDSLLKRLPSALLTLP